MDSNRWKLSMGQSVLFLPEGPGFCSYFVIKDVFIYCLLYGSKERVNLNTSSKITVPTTFLSTHSEYIDADHFYLFDSMPNHIETSINNHY